MDNHLIYCIVCSIIGCIIGAGYARLSPARLISSAMRDYAARKQQEQYSETMRILGSEKTRLTALVETLETENLNLKVKANTAEEVCRMQRKELAYHKQTNEAISKEIQRVRDELSRTHQTIKNQEEFQEHLQTMQGLSVNKMIEEQKHRIMDSIRKMIEPLKRQLEAESTNREGSVHNLENLFKNASLMQKTLLSQVRLFNKSFKIAGDWGERSLTALLDAHGFQQNVDYFSDQHECETIGCTIICANQFVVQISTTTNMEHYRSYANTEDQGTLSSSLGAFTSKIRENIDSLPKKGSGTRDFIIVYIPIEAALIAALNHDPELYSYGIKNKAILASTSMIFVILHALQHFNKINTYHKNAEYITQEAASLVDKFCKLAECMSKTSKSILEAHNTCQESINNIVSGSDSIMEKIHSIADKSQHHSAGQVRDMFDPALSSKECHTT